LRIRFRRSHERLLTRSPSYRIGFAIAEYGIVSWLAKRDKERLPHLSACRRVSHRRFTTSGSRLHIPNRQGYRITVAC